MCLSGNHRKNYMRNYMTKARADGRVSKWRSKMKIKEYNQMMSYLTRPSDKMKGKFG